MSLLAVLYAFWWARSWESVIVLLVFSVLWALAWLMMWPASVQKQQSGLGSKMKLALQAGLAVGALLIIFYFRYS